MSSALHRNCQYTYDAGTDSFRGTFQAAGEYSLQTLVKLTAGPGMITGKDCFKCVINLAVKPPLAFANCHVNIPIRVEHNMLSRVEPASSTVLPYAQFSIQECTTPGDNPHLTCAREGGVGGEWGVVVLAVAAVQQGLLQFDSCSGAIGLHVPSHLEFLRRTADPNGCGLLQAHRFTVIYVWVYVSMSLSSGLCVGMYRFVEVCLSLCICL